MIQNIESLTTVAHVIQLAVAPAFLLTGIGAILSVLAVRYLLAAAPLAALLLLAF